MYKTENTGAAAAVREVSWKEFMFVSLHTEKKHDVQSCLLGYTAV
jgi:hypothetical protein